MNEVIKNIETRRSVRAYTNKRVSREDLAAIMEAGSFAPSGSSSQTPVMVCIRDDRTRNAISKINCSILGEAEGFDPFYGAPELIIVFAKKERGTRVEDGSACILNMLNAAHSLGVDTCWIHRAKETFETPAGKEMMKKWGLSAEYTGIGNVILGYHAGDYPQAKPRGDERIIWVD